MVKASTKFYIKASYSPMREDNDGIWFDGEDPNDVKYQPQNCVNIYMDLANGRY